MRMCLTGMEVASASLLEMMANVDKANTLVQGYGLSECTAVLTVNRLGKPRKGDGLPLLVSSS